MPQSSPCCIADKDQQQQEQPGGNMLPLFGVHHHRPKHQHTHACVRGCFLLESNMAPIPPPVAARSCLQLRLADEVAAHPNNTHGDTFK